jgi:hypothetical protein
MKGRNKHMSTRADALAAKVEQVNKDLLAAVESSTDEQWKSKCADGEWTQGFAGYHASQSIGFISGMIQGIAAGEPFQPTTMAVIDQGNAQQCSEHAGCTKQETVEAIRASSPGAVAMVRALTDEQLDRKATLLEGMPPMTVEQITEMLLIGHAAGHTASIRNAR